MNRRPLQRQGFTLVEVVICLGILVVLTGAVYKTVQATMKATATLSETQRNRQQIFGVFELCRQGFLTINQGASIVWNNQTSGAINLAELDLRQAPTSFTWGSQDSFYGETAICTHSANDGSLTLGIELRQIDPLTGSTEPNPLWLPLLANLKNVTWNFYDTRTSQWQTSWTDTTRHPSLINLSVQYVGQTQVWSQSFLLPLLSAPPAAASATPVATSQTPGTTSTNQPPPPTSSNPNGTNPINPNQTAAPPSRAPIP